MIPEMCVQSIWCVCVCVSQQLTLVRTEPLCETTETPFFSVTQTLSQAQNTQTHTLQPPTQPHPLICHIHLHTNTHTDGAKELLFSDFSIFLFLNIHTIAVST